MALTFNVGWNLSLLNNIPLGVCSNIGVRVLTYKDDVVGVMKVGGGLLTRGFDLTGGVLPAKGSE